MAGEISRRNLGAAGLAALSWGARKAQAEPPRLPLRTDLHTIFEGAETRHQAKGADGALAKVDVPSVAARGDCLVLFGYKGCPRCQEITETVVAVQKKLIAEKRCVPIVVVSTQPTKDASAMTEYLTRYKNMGIQEFASNSAARRQEFAEGIHQPSPVEAPLPERIFHIVLPKDENTAGIIQQRLFDVNQKLPAKKEIVRMDTAGTLPGSPTQHSPYIAHFRDGKMVNVYRGIDKNNAAPAPFVKLVTSEICNAISPRGIGRE